MFHGDLHVHSSYSDGLDDPIAIVRYSIKKGLKVIAITDHDTNHGYFKIMSFYGKSQLKKLDLVVVPGIELSSSIGHMLVLGVDIPLSIERKTFKDKEKITNFIEKLKDKLNAVVIFAHPYSCKGILICPGVKDSSVLEIVDAIEVINGRTMPKKNVDALKLAKKHNKICVAGSDAHRLSEIGATYTLFQNTTSSEDEVLDYVRRGLVKLGPMPKPLSIFKGIIKRNLQDILDSLRIG